MRACNPPPSQVSHVLATSCLLLLAWNAALLPGTRRLYASDSVTVASESDLASRSTLGFAALLKVQAENEFLTRRVRNARLGPEGGFLPRFTSKQALDPRGLDLSQQLLDRNSMGLSMGAKAIVDTWPDNVTQLQQELVVVRRELLRSHEELSEVTSNFGFQNQIATLLNADNRWLWLCGAFSFLCVIGAYAFQNRHSLRRLLHVRASRFAAIAVLVVSALAVPLGPALLTLLLGNQPRDYFQKAIAAAGKRAPYAEEDLTKLEQESIAAQAANKSLRHEWRRLAEDRQRPMRETFGTGSPAFLTHLDEASAQLQALAVQQRLEQGLASALERDVASLQEIRGQIDAKRAGIRDVARRTEWVGTGIGSALLCASLFCGVLLQRRVKAREKVRGRTCPRCLSIGSLVVETTTPMGVAIEDPNLYEMRCTKVLNEAPYTECGFTFSPAYGAYEKISFPTLGVASSGKTHWLATAYRELNHGRYPEGVHFERVRSRGSEEFDRIVDNIYASRISTSATSLDLPHPVIFSFRDHDRPLASNVLLNLFDFAGTVTINVDLHSLIRQRQLKSEGFLFFLDPTYPSDKQADALVKFREEVKISKRLKSGQQLDTPVAMCITKIDLLPTVPELSSGDLVNQFFSDLKDLDTAGDSMSLSAMRDKSLLVARLRDQIWPNWEIERQVKSLFGERFLFFPMTPVGLNELGETDLSRRTISPYGILQPILWLLHMNGYPILKH